MAGLEGLERQRVDRQLFPLREISSVVQLFKEQLDKSKDPDLALLSIVAGAVENSLTCNRANVLSKDDGSDSEEDACEGFEIEYHIVDALYSKFHAIILGSVDLSVYGNYKYATRELVKKVSDVIWNTLSRSYYKDRAHLQSLFSYLTGNKLDCFGVALAVVAGCQVLGFNDVHLALSEDHAWVVFGENGSETAEVTWHGKGNEDKRGQPIGSGCGSRSWLYVNGKPVICDRFMEVSALVSSVNPSLNVTSEAKEVAELQKELLWLLYDRGYLERYPMALGNLGDLEEISPSPGRPPCSELFSEAVTAARKFYGNQHVYPYTYQGGYFFRQKMFKEALECWANAADVLREYNYSRDDEELYKELMDIANELIPHVMKAVGSGHDAHSLLKDTECFAHLLRLYDGICEWEEGSMTPVLHIGWAKPLVNTIAKFDASVRAQLVIDPLNAENEHGPVKEDIKEPTKNENQSSTPQEEVSGDKKKDTSSDKNKQDGAAAGDTLNNNNYAKGQNRQSPANTGTGNGPASSTSLHPTIKALAAACSEKILNPEFLLQGDGEPFVAGCKEDLTSTGIDGGSGDTSENVRVLPSNKSGFNGWTNSGATQGTNNSSHTKSPATPPVTTGLSHTDDGRPKLALSSRKMQGLKELLLSEKLNTQAISLQLTAQSQVQVGRKGRPSLQEPPMGSRPKRTRRD